MQNHHRAQMALTELLAVTSAQYRDRAKQRQRIHTQYDCHSHSAALFPVSHASCCCRVAHVHAHCTPPVASLLLPAKLRTPQGTLSRYHHFSLPPSLAHQLQNFSRLIIDVATAVPTCDAQNGNHNLMSECNLESDVRPTMPSVRMRS